MQKEKQDTNEGRGGGVSMCIKILLFWLDNHLTWSLRAKFYPWPPKKNYWTLLYSWNATARCATPLNFAVNDILW